LRGRKGAEKPRVRVAAPPLEQRGHFFPTTSRFNGETAFPHLAKRRTLALETNREYTEYVLQSLRRDNLTRRSAVSLGLILLIILVIALLGGFSGRGRGYGYGYGHRGTGLIGIVLVIVLILVLLDKI
jgi:hypothetical protein